jgi:phage shock protein PspC (stress-responsive transcriptional regulator)
MSTADEIAKLHDLLIKGALTPQEFEQAKARLLASAPLRDVAINRLRRVDDDRWLGGVCGGIARLTGIDAWFWRLVFAIAAFAGGAGIVLYVLLWIFVPPAAERTG